MILVVTMLVGALPWGAARAGPAPADAAAELSRLEAVWNEAHLRRDAEALDRLWADDLVVTVPGMEPFGKPDALGALRSGRFRFDRYQTTDLRVRVYGETAVVAGRLRRRRQSSGRTVDDDWRFTKVYVRRDGRWQVVAFHASESGG